MNIIIKALIGILFGVALGLAAVPLAKRLILSRSEDPGDFLQHFDEARCAHDADWRRYSYLG